MHVCYVIWKFKSPKNFQQMGGAEKQLLKVVENLKDKKDIKVTIISKKLHDDSIKESISHNVSIQRVKSTNIQIISVFIFSFVLFFHLINLNKKKKIDLIHLPLPDLYLLPILVLRRILKFPVIARIAADELFPFRSHGFWYLERIIVRKMIMMCDAIQTLNNQTYIFAKSEGVNENQLYLIPNGIENLHLSKTYAKLTKKIVYIGAMRFYPKKHKIEQKNLQFLIQAFYELLKFKEDLELVMVGDGNYRNYLEKLVNELGIEEKVTFTGYKLNIHNYLMDADIFVNPSHYEGMPNTVLEAMSRGILVLCSNIPEHYFFITDKTNGLLFNHTNIESFVSTIIDYYKNPKSFNKIAKNGYNYVINNHSIEHIIKLILAMYRNVIKNYN